MGAPVYVPCFLVATQIKRALFTIAECINSIHPNTSTPLETRHCLAAYARLTFMARLSFSEPRSSWCPLLTKCIPFRSFAQGARDRSEEATPTCAPTRILGSRSRLKECHDKAVYIISTAGNDATKSGTAMVRR
jgi:hypothetical protein